MSRSSRKGPHVDIKLLRKIEVQKTSGGRQPIKTWSRSCTVVPFAGGAAHRLPHRALPLRRRMMKMLVWFLRWRVLVPSRTPHGVQC